MEGTAGAHAPLAVERAVPALGGGAYPVLTQPSLPSLQPQKPPIWKYPKKKANFASCNPNLFHF